MRRVRDMVVVVDKMTSLSGDGLTMTTEGQPGLMDADCYSLVVIFSFIFNIIFCPLGIVFNIINIVVFCTLGFKESTNIILVSLAVVDICILSTFVGVSLNLYVGVTSAVTLDVLDAVTLLILGWPNVVATRISGCLTTYLTFERFLCVVLPLRVKTILQKKTALTFIIAMCLFSMAYSVPMYLANSIGLRFNPMSNQTSVGLIVADNSDILEGVSISVNVIIELITFILVIIFTFGLISAYFRTTKWRQKVSAVSKNSQFSSRDQKLVKMVLLISVIFIGCTLPSVVVDVVVLVVSDYNLKGREKFLFLATTAISFNFISLNSVVNIFIYLNMSSKFRRVFWVKLYFGNVSKNNKDKQKKMEHRG
ncbi:type-1 angiotensin II receptor-like [Physella acuta]|uniref:type-1 angiotensin II receptor-like n=1 Tax=Physella acuta TaxID=109671 RepID=UPI0027DDCB65|nr:type-1 angiotensin II receptor-like [Physella acuta]